jgi:Concanavalin A-like lectin/glucanases superfamily
MTRDRRAVAGIALLFGAAGAIVALEAWHGPNVLTLSAGHGVDTGDLLAFPLAALAVAVVRARAARRAPGGWAAPASAIALGVLLLLAGVAAKGGGGPLVPSGGGTFDGTIRQVTDTVPVPVGRWSNVAVTYDDATLRMYVNGRQVSSRAVTGTIESPQTPLWIGGNEPYGEHFDGLIDEVRIYDRALSGDAVRRDMTRPVAPAPGLLAGYSFAAGSGTAAADASGNGNTGEIEAAAWARGRYGDALRFDGDASLVRVPASPSLKVTRTMTLSGWVRPGAPQDGWRTIVQRQVDAWILTAGSDRQSRSGWVDDVRAALLAAVAAWFCVMVATARSPWSAARRRLWWMPAALFTLGSLADAVLAPTGALIGPALVALWLAATAKGRVERVTFVLAAAACAGLTLAADPARDDGSLDRAVALGALFVIGGLTQLATVRRTRFR